MTTARRRPAKAATKTSSRQEGCPDEGCPQECHGEEGHGEEVAQGRPGALVRRHRADRAARPAAGHGVGRERSRPAGRGPRADPAPQRSAGAHGCGGRCHRPRCHRRGPGGLPPGARHPAGGLPGRGRGRRPPSRRGAPGRARPLHARSPRRVLAEVGDHPLTVTVANDGNLPISRLRSCGRAPTTAVPIRAPTHLHAGCGDHRHPARPPCSGAASPSLPSSTPPAAHRPGPRRHCRPRRHHPASRPIGVITMSTTAPEYLSSLRHGFAYAVQQWMDQSTTAWDQWSQAWAPVAEAAGLGMPVNSGAAPGRRSKGGHWHGHDHPHGHDHQHGEKGCGCGGSGGCAASTVVGTVTRRALEPAAAATTRRRRATEITASTTTTPTSTTTRSVAAVTCVTLRAGRRRHRASPGRRGAGGPLPAAQPLAPEREVTLEVGPWHGCDAATWRSGRSWRSRRWSSRRARTGWSACWSRRGSRRRRLVERQDLATW